VEGVWKNGVFENGVLTKGSGLTATAPRGKIVCVVRMGEPSSKPGLESGDRRNGRVREQGK